MKSLFKFSLFILIVSNTLISCSHHKSQDRAIAQSQESCWETIKSDYHSYFDSVEKCIEKQSEK